MFLLSKVFENQFNRLYQSGLYRQRYLDDPEVTFDRCLTILPRRRRCRAGSYSRAASAPRAGDRSARVAVVFPQFPEVTK